MDEAVNVSSAKPKPMNPEHVSPSNPKRKDHTIPSSLNLGILSFERLSLLPCVVVENFSLAERIIFCLRVHKTMLCLASTTSARAAVQLQHGHGPTFGPLREAGNDIITLREQVEVKLPVFVLELGIHAEECPSHQVHER